ncbi:uncharacterized protein TNCV_2350181 [Trichonephila clavipes]|uniref:Uncharacterized protein n=1 Tax=Trichonephila clavipes TaxID=2585209 RepID=A0A8X6VPZ0_TRICX|nr:uncharacterized protein TNCV_2350181 [Trichonephila clavipes]
MKQKRQTKNKHSGSVRARSDQWTMDIQNRLKSTLEGKINRIEMFIESANKETDSVEIKVKLRSLIQLQKNVEELCNNYYAIPNVKDVELTAIDEDLHLLEVRLESLEVRIETILNSSKKSSSGAVMKTNDNFEIKTKIPPLVLPEFSGKYEEFSSFKIQFDELITNNILLSESQKKKILFELSAEYSTDVCASATALPGLRMPSNSDVTVKRVVLACEHGKVGRDVGACAPTSCAQCHHASLPHGASS